MVKSIQVIILLLLIGCEEPCKSDCSINIYSELPQNEDGAYILNWNPNLVTTYSHLYVETTCGLHTKVSWDSDTQYQLSSVDWTNLINPASMTDEDGNAKVMFGAWEPFIGYTVTVYCGYTDLCGVHHTDSIQITIVNEE